jgi:hypothetical protein
MTLRNVLVTSAIALSLALGWTSTAVANDDGAAAEEEAPPVDSAPPSDTEEGAEGEEDEAEATE